MIYYNYHKHDIYSNTRINDVVVKSEEYMKRAKELGHKAFFTTNHGCSGNVFESYDLCKKHDLKCIFGMECYFVLDRFKKSGNNYHIIIIALNKQGYRDLNRINSEANISGFWKQPRIDMNLLLSLNPENVVVTTACIFNPLFMEEDKQNIIKNYLVPARNHFEKHFFLEIQNHFDTEQIKWNKQAIKLSNDYSIPIIHANDSHYISPEDAPKRNNYLKGKGFKYSFEDNFVLDYPDCETIIERYQKQNILNRKQILESIKNTLIFEKSEDLNLDKSIKMPSIDKDLTLDERLEKLRKIINISFKEYSRNLNKQELKIRKKGITEEFKVIEDTNSEVQIADYFLVNKAIIDKAVNEYGGILSKTGRGSAVSMFINKLLGFTEIDRFDADVPLYPSRFISSSRLLESKSMPDIDFNVADDKPFVKSSKDILGEHGVYKMVAYGKLKDSAAFRNVCREKGLDVSEYNDVGKDLSKHENDSKWKDIIAESKQYVDVIDSISPSPCSFVMLNDDIREEIGVMKIGSELCACIDGYTADIWKFLKNDFLIVTVWEIIYKVFKKINKPIPSIKELKSLLDEKVWSIYEKGLSVTLNQADSDFSISVAKMYKPKTPAEMAAFVAILRPACESFRDEFIQRIPYTSGTKKLDEILESSAHRLIYQENLMAYFSWLGIPESETYDLIKKIAKKKFAEQEFKELKEILKNGRVSIKR